MLITAEKVKTYCSECDTFLRHYITATYYSAIIFSRHMVEAREWYPAKWQPGKKYASKTRRKKFNQ